MGVGGSVSCEAEKNDCNEWIECGLSRGLTKCREDSLVLGRVGTGEALEAAQIKVGECRLWILSTVPLSIMERV